ncbi:MAG: hypothetical protein ACRDB0_08280, partial [Paraclostridium sp.]
MLVDVEKLNEDLDKRCKKYLFLKEQISIAIKNNVPIDDFINEINNEDLIASKDRLRHYIISSLSKDLSDSAKKIANLMQYSKEELQGHRNRKLLLNFIQRDICNKIKDYNEMAISEILTNNWHLDAYINTRNQLLDYISSVSELEIETEEIENKEVKKLKYKQRLRVTYDELQRF